MAERDFLERDTLIPRIEQTIRKLWQWAEGKVKEAPWDPKTCIPRVGPVDQIKEQLVQISEGETLTEKSRLSLRRTFPEIKQYWVELKVRQDDIEHSVDMYQTDSMYWVLLCSENLVDLQVWPSLSPQRRKELYDMFFFLEHNYGRGFMLLTIFGAQTSVFICLMILTLLKARPVLESSRFSLRLFGLVTKEEINEYLLLKVSQFKEDFILNFKDNFRNDEFKKHRIPNDEERSDLESWEVAKIGAVFKIPTDIEKKDLAKVLHQKTFQKPSEASEKAKSYFQVKSSIAKTSDSLIKSKKSPQNLRLTDIRQQVRVMKMIQTRKSESSQRQAGPQSKSDQTKKSNFFQIPSKPDKTNKSSSSQPTPSIMTRIKSKSRNSMFPLCFLQFFAVLLIMLSQASVFIVDNVIHTEYKQSSEFILSTDPFDRSQTVDWLHWNIDQQNKLMKKISSFKPSDLPSYMSSYYGRFISYQQGNICEMKMISGSNSNLNERSLL